MITTNDDTLAVNVRALRDHGAAKNGALARENIYGIPATEEIKDSLSNALYNPYKYYNYIIGYNSRLDAVQAVVLSIKLKHLDEFNQKRKKIADFYTSNLKKYAITPLSQGCWHQYAIRVEDKKGLVEYLAKNNIGAGEFYPVPLHLQKAFQYLGYKPGSLPVAELVCKQTVCLPIFPELEEQELESVVAEVKSFLGANT
jgi:dTDP-4-amino-4,6-dideoxygalactose transaminase